MISGWANVAPGKPTDPATSLGPWVRNPMALSPWFAAMKQMERTGLGGLYVMMVGHSWVLGYGSTTAKTDNLCAKVQALLRAPYRPGIDPGGLFQAAGYAGNFVLSAGAPITAGGSSGVGHVRLPATADKVTFAIPAGTTRIRVLMQGNGGTLSTMTYDIHNGAGIIAAGAGAVTGTVAIPSGGAVRYDNVITITGVNPDGATHTMIQFTGATNLPAYIVGLAFERAEDATAPIWVQSCGISGTKLSDSGHNTVRDTISWQMGRLQSMNWAGKLMIIVLDTNAASLGTVTAANEDSTLSTYLAALPPDMPVLLVSDIPRGTGTPATQAANARILIDSFIGAASKFNQVAFYDMWGETSGGDYTTTLASSVYSSYANADVVHPNTVGHAYFAQLIAQVVQGIKR